MPGNFDDYRVVVFGPEGVGKSSLIFRFVRGVFLETYVPTIEDTYRQDIISNNKVCTLLITDTTGSQQFPAMQHLSISKGHAFVFVYSITSQLSLDNLISMYNMVVDIRGSTLDDCPIILVGNKCDQEESREVSQEAGENVAESWNCPFIETSAKENIYVKDMFQELLTMETKHKLALIKEPEPQRFRRRRSTVQTISKDKCIIM